MISFFYNLLLLVASVGLIPRWLLKEKYRGTILERLGIKLPPAPLSKPTIWIHMVSMGETRAMISMYQALRQTYPTGNFYCSSTTKTGHKEAQKSLPGALGYFILPLDISWLMQRLVKRIQPDLLLLSEGDFWYHMMKSVKERGGKVILLNGKISETSFRRFSQVPTLSQKLFQQIDLFCLQNVEYEKRFHALSIPNNKIVVTGNLKLAIPIQSLSEKEKASFRAQLGLLPLDRVITLGSTHEAEEELLLAQIKKIPQVKFLLVPRHPERFKVVKKWLEKAGNEQILLVDQMGILTRCYQISELAIVGGSFFPGVGGHNIFEPIQAQIPVIFGPFMHSQNELTKLVLENGAGIQTPIENLSEVIERLLKSPSPLRENAQKLSLKGKETHAITWEALQNRLELKQ